MINDIPSSQEFINSGKELLDFAWDTTVELLVTLDRGADHDYFLDEVSEDYWASAKRSLTTALAIAQQGTEFILKGKIAEISIYLLLADPPPRWPSPYEENKPIFFHQFRTIDAQDLVRTLDTFSPVRLPAEFVERYNSMREQRNTIMHSVDRNLGVQVETIIETILFVHKHLLPDECWTQERKSFLTHSPHSVLYHDEFVNDRVCHEFSLIFDLLKPAKLKSFFNFPKKQRRYYCPSCLDQAHDGLDEKLAVLVPKGPQTTNLFCPICNENFPVTRNEHECGGNVIFKDDVCYCLTCGTEAE